MRVLRWSTRPMRCGGAQLVNQRGKQCLLMLLMSCQEAVKRGSFSGGGGVWLLSQARDRQGCCAFYCNACPLLRVPRSQQPRNPSTQVWHMATRLKAYTNRRIQTVALETLLPCILSTVLVLLRCLRGLSHKQLQHPSHSSPRVCVCSRCS